MSIIVNENNNYQNQLKLNISTININGNFSNKIDIINNLLTYFNIDILNLNETKLNLVLENKIKNLFNNYMLITNPATIKKKYLHHGSGILIKKIYYNCLEDVNIWNDKRTISFTLNLIKLGESQTTFNKINFISVYAPANSNTKEKNNYFKTILTYIKQQINPNIIIGDFNITYNYEDDMIKSKCKNFNKLLNKYMTNPIPPNTYNYTYFKGKDKSYIDYILISSELHKLCINQQIYNEYLLLSPDHKRVTITLDFPITNNINNNNLVNNKQIKINKQAINNKNILKYQQLLKKHHINYNLSIEQLDNDINEKIIENATNTFGITTKINKYKRKCLPKYIVNLHKNLVRLIKAKLTIKQQTNWIKIPKRLSNLKLNEPIWRINIEEINENNYNFYSNKIDSLLKKCKQKYKTKLKEFHNKKINKAIEEAQYSYKTSPKKFFQKLNINKCQQNQNISTLKINNKISNNSKEIKNHVKDFFQNIFEKKTDKKSGFPEEWTKTEHIKKAKEILSMQSKTLLNPISDTELDYHINKLANNKATPTLLINECIKILNNETKNDIKVLFNRILQEKTIPNNWKKSKTLPIFKNRGSILDINNYRPITLTPAMYKLFMSIINDRLTKLFENNNIFHPNQNGFRKNRSTFNNIYNLIETIQDSKTNKKSLGLCYLDLNKCYDSIEHWVIEYILNLYGINSEFTELITNIYSNNNTSIITGHGETENISINRGVKQGCPMSPLIFLIIINPLLWWIEERCTGYNISNLDIKLLAFCDDLILISQNPHDLQRMINFISKYNYFCGLKLNIDNSKSKTAIEHDFFVIQNNTIQKIPHLNSNESYKYLGIHINLDLNWTKQQIIIKDNLIRHLNHLKNRCYTTTQIITIINKVIIPSVEYRLNIIKFSDKYLNNLDWIISNFIYNKLKIKGYNSSIHLSKPAKYGGFNVTNITNLAKTAPIKLLNQLFNSKDKYTITILKQKLGNPSHSKIFQQH